MVSPRARPTPIGLLPLATNESFGEVTIRMYRAKARYKYPFLAGQLLMFSALARTGWSRSCVPVLRWFRKLQSTQ
jgi:hypothetical protein